MTTSYARNESKNFIDPKGLAPYSMDVVTNEITQCPPSLKIIGTSEHYHISTFFQTIIGHLERSAFTFKLQRSVLRRSFTRDLILK